MVKAGAQRKQAGNASLLPVVKIQKKKFSKEKKIIKAAQATAHTAVETLPPTRSGRSGLPFQVLCPAGAPHRSEHQRQLWAHKL